MSDPVEALIRLADQWEANRHLTRDEAVADLRQAAYAIRSESAGTGLDSVRLGRAIYEAGAMDIAPVDWTATIQAVIAAEYARLSSSDTDWPRHAEGCPANGGSFLVCTCNLSSSDTAIRAESAGTGLDVERVIAAARLTPAYSDRWTVEGWAEGFVREYDRLSSDTER